MDDLGGGGWYSCFAVRGILSHEIGEEFLFLHFVGVAMGDGHDGTLVGDDGVVMAFLVDTAGFHYRKQYELDDGDCAFQVRGGLGLELGECGFWWVLFLEGFEAI
jgi:hypothetical protein